MILSFIYSSTNTPPTQLSSKQLNAETPGHLGDGIIPSFFFPSYRARPEESTESSSYPSPAQPQPKLDSLSLSLYRGVSSFNPNELPPNLYQGIEIFIFHRVQLSFFSQSSRQHSSSLSLFATPTESPMISGRISFLSK